jgi:hypothetical protein
MLSQPDQVVRHFRDVLVWPVQIRPGFSGENVARIHHLMTADGQWAPIDDEFSPIQQIFRSATKEFVAFLPYVQRFLYGDSRSGGFDGQAHQAAPMAVFRRTDVAGLNVTPQAGDVPIHLRVAHVDLYLFLDMDVALLNVEVAADDLPLATALELLYRFGRAYPTGWDSGGQGAACIARSCWTGRGGCSPPLTPKTGSVICISCADTGRPASAPCGPGCCGRWYSIRRRRSANCVSG